MGTQNVTPLSGEVMPPPKHPGGRPTIYKPEYCQAIVDYFEAAMTAPNRELAPIKTDETYGDDLPAIAGSPASNKGKSKREVRYICAELPTIEGFGISIGVSRKAMLEWTERHPEFGHAYARAKDIQYQILVDRGLTRQYDPAAFAFVAKNITWMRDKTEVVSTNATDSRVVELLRAMPASTRNTVIEALRAAEAKLAEAGSVESAAIEAPAISPNL